MSWYGDNSFKQSILDEVEYQKKENDLTTFQIVAALAEIIQDLSERADDNNG